MRYRPATLADAQATAAQLQADLPMNIYGIDLCEVYRQSGFVVEGFSIDGTEGFGYCLNPACRYEVTDLDATQKAYARLAL